MARFGETQVNRYLEKAKLATEDSFTENLEPSYGSSQTGEER